MINLELEDAEEIMNQFSYMTNNLVFKVNKTAEEYQDSALMEVLDLCWIRALANPDYRTDLRNEASAKIGRQLSKIPFVAERLKLSNDLKMKAVAEKMAQEHRTIRQTFSKLIFYHFLTTCTQKESGIYLVKISTDFL